MADTVQVPEQSRPRDGRVAQALGARLVDGRIEPNPHRDDPYAREPPARGLSGRHRCCAAGRGGLPVAQRVFDAPGQRVDGGGELTAVAAITHLLDHDDAAIGRLIDRAGQAKPRPSRRVGR